MRALARDHFFQSLERWRRGSTDQRKNSYSNFESPEIPKQADALVVQLFPGQT